MDPEPPDCAASSQSAVINEVVAKLIYFQPTSLDGYIEDKTGSFEWAAPDSEVHAFVNDLVRPVGTFLYGRRMYETMIYWETASAQPDQSPIERDFTDLWQAADKIVFSRTLEATASARTRLERDFDPDAIRALKASATRDIGIGGPGLAAHALAAGLVDEIQLLLSPVVVGGGKPALPDGVRLDLTLITERRFASGTVYLHYRVAG